MNAPTVAHFRRTLPLRRGILAGSVLALLAGQSLAQTWNGGGGDNLWGTGANWVGGLAPTPGATTDLIFAGVVRLTPLFNYTDGDDFRDITFAAGAGAFTINPDTGVASKGIDWFGNITNNSASVQTLGINLYLQGTGRTLAATSNALVVNGNVFNNGNGLTVSGTNATSINGLLTLGGATQTFTVNTGATLNLANIDFTHTGGTGKVLTLAGAGNTNITGTLSNILNGSSRLDINSTGVTDLSGIVSNSAAGQLQFTLGAGSTLRASNANFMGSLVAAYPDKLRFLGSSTFNATGTYTLGSSSGANTQGLRIEAASTATFNVNSGNTLTVSGAFSEAGGAGKLTKTGAGTMILNPSVVNTYTGLTTVNRGTLTLDFANLATPTNLISATSPLSLGGGTISVLGKSAGATAQTFAGTTFASGRTVFALNRGTGTSTTVALGAVTNAAGGVVNFQPNTAWVASTAPTTEIVTVTGVTRNGTAITIPGAGSSAYVGANVYYGTGVSTRYAIVLGAASAPYTLTLGPAATAFVTTGGSASTVYSIAAAQTLAGATTNYALIANATGAMAFANGGFSYTTNGFLNVNTGTVTFSGAGSLVIGAEKDFVVNNTSTGALTVNSVIANSAGGASSVSINSTGTAVTTFSGANNTYTGGTYFNSGTLSVVTDLNLGAAPGAATPGNLTFNGGTLSLTPAGAITIAANRGTLLNPGGGTITNTAGQAITYNGIIAGSGGITFNPTSASGSFTLGGNSTFTGGATLSGAGIIAPTNANAFGIGGTLTLNGAQIRSTTAAPITVANPVNIAVNTNFPTIAAEKSLTFSGATTITGGTRTLTSLVGSTVAGTAIVFSGNISESTALSGITKAGAGVVTLSGVNTYTGPTTVSVGRLSFGKASSLYSNNPASWTAANITVASGATLALSVGGTNEFSSANIDTISALGTATNGFLSNSALGLDTTSGSFTHSGILANPNAGANVLNLVKLGTNNLTLSGTNTYTGQTYIGGGTLVAANPAAFGPAGNSVNFIVNPVLATAGGNITNGNVEFATDSTVNAYNFNGSSSFASSITVSRATSGAAFNHTLGNLAWGSNTLTVAAGTNIASGTPSVSFTGMNLTSGGAGTSTLAPTTATIAITGPVNIGTNNVAKTLGLGGTIAGNSISGDITNGLNTLSVLKNDTGAWTLSGNNTYTGTTTVSVGTLAAGSATAFSSTSAFSVNGGTLDLAGFNNSVGSLAGTGGTVALNGGVLTAGVDNTSTSYSGAITGAGGLTKTGTGTLTLPSAVGSTGALIVNGGTLLLNNTVAGTVTAASGGTLGGIGPISGLTTVNAGGLLSPATSTTAGTLTLAGLTLDSGSALAYEFGGTSDLVAVTGASALTINGGALNLFAAGGLTPLTANGTYNLFTYNTALGGGSAANLSVANSQAGKAYSVNDTGSIIQLIVGTATSSDWTNGNATNLWTDAGNWSGVVPNSFGAVANFAIAGSSVAVDGPKTVGAIIFDNATGYTLTGAGADTITLDNGIAAGAISTVTGSHTINAPIVLAGPANFAPATATTLTVGGVISGPKAMSYSGLGATILTANNTYSGATTVGIGSTLQLGDGGASGALASASSITNNGTLKFNRSNTLTQGTDFANGISGSGGISQIGAGTTVLSSANTYSGATSVTGGTLNLTGAIGFTTITVGASGTFTEGSTGVIGGTASLNTSGNTTLAGANTYTGATTVAAGVLNIQHATALGTIGAGTTVASGASLQIQGGITTPAEALTINGTGGGNGALRNISGNNIWGTAVAMASASTIGSDADSLTIPSLTGAFSLTKAGAGTVNITNTTTLTGLTVDAGSLYLGAQTGPSTTVTVGAAIPVTLNGTGSLTIRRTNTGGTDTTGVISGTGTLNLIGDSIATPAAGDFTLNNASPGFTGTTNITAARANITLGDALGTGPVIVGTNGQVFFGATLTSANNFTIGGNGWNEPTGLLGALRLNASTLTGSINLTSPTRITGQGTSTFSGVISGTGPIEFFNSASTTTLGTIVLNGDNTFSGGVTVATGGLTGTPTLPVLTAGHSNALGIGTTVLVNGTSSTTFGTRLSLNNGVNIGGKELTLDSSAATGLRSALYVGSGATARWDGNIVVKSFSPPSGNSVQIYGDTGGNITVGASDANTVTTTTNSTLTLRGGGVGLMNSTLNLGTGGITKTDSGTWTIASNNNDFTGNVSIVFGTLSAGSVADIGVNSAIGKGSQINLGQATTSQLGVFQFTGAGGGSTNRAIQINNNATLGSGTIENMVAGQTLTLSGNLTTVTPAATTAAVFTLGGVGNGVLSGAITGAPVLNLAKTGTGTWTLSGDNTHSGTNTLTAGTLNLGSAQSGTGGPLGGTGTVASVGVISFGGGTLQFSAANTTDYSSRFSEASGMAYRLDTNGQNVTWATGRTPTGTGSLTKLGSGTLDVTTAANGWTGATTIEGGVLQAAALANFNTNSSIGKGSVAGSAADLVLAGGTLRYANTTGPATTNRLFTIGNANGLTAALDSSATSSANTLSFTATGAIGFGGSGARTLTLTGSNTGANTLAPVLGDGTGGTTALVKNGAGTWLLSGANTFTGGTTVTNGTLQLGTGAGGGTTGSLSGTGTITNNATLAFNRSNAIVQGTDFGSVIAGSGVVNHIGNGTTTFNGANTYTGVTTVSAGTLQLNRGTADNSAIPTDANTATTSDIVINGGNLVISASEQIGDSGSINLSSGAFNFGAATGLTETIDKLTVSGGAFTTGANSLLVGGATVTWSGGTNTISTGGLVSDKHWVITGGTNTVQQNGLLRVQNGTGTVGLFFGGTNSPTITLDSHATDPGEILLKQDVTVDNTLTSGTAQILSGGSDTLPGSIDMNGGTRTWSVNNGSAAVDLLVSASITNGGLIKADAGNLKLTGNNTFTGDTTIAVSGGTLEAGAAGALGATTKITVNTGGTLLLSGAGNRINDDAEVVLGTSATGSFNADGLSETVGLLTLSATSVIDMGAGASLLHFSDSNLATWTGTLSIWNWSGLPVSGGGTDRIFFGDGTGTGLTASQLLQVSFYSDAGSTLFSSPTGFVGSSGEIAPVPEPSSVATVLGLLGLVGWRERRKGQAARRMERCQ